ncbi:hypothetical protein D9M68_239910 [compost metagenome]
MDAPDLPSFAHDDGEEGRLQPCIRTWFGHMPAVPDGIRWMQRIREIVLRVFRTTLCSFPRRVACGEEWADDRLPLFNECLFLGIVAQTSLRTGLERLLTWGMYENTELRLLCRSVRRSER